MPAQHGAGGGFGVERVALAPSAPELPVGAVDLEDGMPALAQEAGQPGAVGARALDAEGPDGPESPGPAFQLSVAFETDRDGRSAQAGAARVDRDRGMDVLVGKRGEEALLARSGSG